jgi:SAM-dependent methyltransferase
MTGRRVAPGAGQATRRDAGAAPDEAAETGMFRRWAGGYAAERPGMPVAALLAGAVTAAGDLGLAALAVPRAGPGLALLDDDQPVTRSAVASAPALGRCGLGDLRTVPLPPRSFDIVACTGLLDRIEHAELVLDRLIAALKPGGLLLLQVRDRDCAAGWLDRRLPGGMRAAIWQRHRPGRPGPHPAVYERLSSARGVASYALLRGLVVADRQALGGNAGGLAAAPRGYLAAQRMVARLSGDRLTAAHEELLFVMRKPENRFARILEAASPV